MIVTTLLDALTFPLHGRRLIEASAGTGKTYTIANLFLRLVLGHSLPDRPDTAHREPLEVERILVVTFTEAATRELRERIRLRLGEARNAFTEGRSEDDFIAQLIATVERSDHATQLLLTAERQMDEASIFTIHGFCQRMLKQFAFESGSLFSVELLGDESDLLNQATTDFWRTAFYSLDKPLANIALDCWESPKELLDTVLPLLNKTNLEIVTGDTPTSQEDFCRRCIEPLLEIKALWRKESNLVEQQLQLCGLKKNSKPYRRITQMSQFMRDEQLVPQFAKGEGIELFGPKSLTKALGKQGSLPDHPIFQKIEDYASSTPPLHTAFRNMITMQARSYILQRVRQFKRSKNQLSFDDLLTDLHQALTAEEDSTLSQALRERYPVAMIDEFQDTDPLQYDIFSKIYPNNNSDERSTGLLMIGDPKQAIYAFRGADIFTYMQARHQVQAHYSLGTNWRSSSDMVEAVNRFFSRAGETGDRAPFIYDDIPFEPVSPSARADRSRLTEGGDPVPAMTLWWQTQDDGEAINKGNYEETMTLATASRINRLLSDRLWSIEKDGEKKNLQAGDIAILVRTGRQAGLIRQALADQGIASVYLSSSDSVFSAPEALDLSRILAACLHPNDGRILRTALATPLLGLSAVELDALNDNEQAWERAVGEFSDYHRVWQRQGVLPMVRQLIRRRNILPVLLSGQNGERRITDLMHTAELLATAGTELETPHALYRWLSDQINKPRVQAEEQQLHLESEHHLVKIVTIHKSKGLEYPVVFLPFVCTHRKEESSIYHKNNRTVLDLSGDPEALELADRERLAEDIRLLYVALTRSIYHVCLGTAPLRPKYKRSGTETDFHQTAAGWLLGGATTHDCLQVKQALEQLVQQHPAIVLEPVDLKPMPRFQPSDPPPTNLAARQFNGVIRNDWRVTSYSALANSLHGGGHASADGLSPLPADSSTAADKNEADAINRFTFPRGARPGTFLHTLFENLPTHSPQQHNRETMQPYVLRQLQLAGFEEKWCDGLTEMLDHCLNATLDDSGMTLGSIPEQQKKIEMEFHLPIDRLNAHELDQLIRKENPLSVEAPELAFETVRGMLKGFIDLTFCHQQRWYVLDYKSNWLGNRPEDYSQRAMQQAMLSHRYDLQYLLYSLALHRLLSVRLPDYAYQNHFGGVFYLFIRGVHRSDATRPGVFYSRPSARLIEQLDSLFAGDRPKQLDIL